MQLNMLFFGLGIVLLFLFGCTGQPTTKEVTEDEAYSAMTTALDAIETANAAGNDIRAADEKLAEAQEAVDSGDYAKAKQLANEAKALAESAEEKPSIGEPPQLLPTATKNSTITLNRVRTISMSEYGSTYNWDYSISLKITGRAKQVSTDESGVLTHYQLTNATVDWNVDKRRKETNPLGCEHLINTVGSGSGSVEAKDVTIDLNTDGTYTLRWSANVPVTVTKTDTVLSTATGPRQCGMVEGDPGTSETDTYSSDITYSSTPIGKIIANSKINNGKYLDGQKMGTMEPFIMELDQSEPVTPKPEPEQSWTVSWNIVLPPD